MTTLKGALDRVRIYLQQLPDNARNVGAHILIDRRFRSEEWSRATYPLTRDDLQAILAEAVPYERPSRFSGAPEQWDAWFREVMADDGRLAFYRWIGEKAIRAAVADARMAAERNHVEGKDNPALLVRANETLDEIDPSMGPVAYPTELPLGLPFCDDPHHTHTHGGSRLPSCRLDSSE